MELYLFTVVLAVLAVALLGVVVHIVRTVMRSRSADGAAPKAARAARMPSAPPHPPEPPRQRRRQITAASIEEVAEQDATPPPAELEPVYQQQVLARLEEAFERYQREEITLADYRALVLNEEADAARRTAELNALAGDGAPAPEKELADLAAAAEAVRWCLDWIDEQQGGEPTG